MNKLFVGGMGRSGTTLLVNLMGLHSALCPIYETEFVYDLLMLFLPRNGLSLVEKKKRYGGLVGRWGNKLSMMPTMKGDHERYPYGPHYITFTKEYLFAHTEAFLNRVDRGNLRQCLRAYILDILTLQTRDEGKPRWVNKVPKYIHVIHLLHYLFPGMKFINCVRDGRDVYCSARHLFDDWRTAARRLSFGWVDACEKAQQFRQRHPDQYFEVRFGDLIRGDAELLNSLCRFANLPEEGEEIVRAFREDYHLSFSQNPRARWKTEMNGEELALFNQTAGEWLERLGYC